MHMTAGNLSWARVVRIHIRRLAGKSSNVMAQLSVYLKMDGIAAEIERRHAIKL